MRFFKNNQVRAAVYAVFVVILVSLAYWSFIAASQRTALPIEENYQVSVVKDHNNSIDFSGGSVKVNLSAPTNLSISFEDDQGISISNSSYQYSALGVTEVVANSIAGESLNIYQYPNSSSNGSSGYFNDTSSSLVSSSDIYATYIDASYSTGQLNIQGSDASMPVRGSFVFNNNYSEQLNKTGPISLDRVLSPYYLNLNESAYGKYLAEEDYLTINLQGDPAGGLSSFVMDYSGPQSVGIVLNGNTRNAQSLSPGALWITGYKSLTVHLISENSVTLIPYDFVSGIDIPFSQSPIPTLDVLSNNIGLINSSGNLDILNGYLAITSIGGISIQTSPYHNDSEGLVIGIYATSQSASAVFNERLISQEYLINQNRTIFYSAFAGAIISAAIAMVLDPIRDKIWPKKRS